MNVQAFGGAGCSAPSILPSLSVLEGNYNAAANGFGAQSLRADGATPSADDVTHGARMLIRHYVESAARACEHRRRVDTGVDSPVPVERKAMIARALTRALGIREVNGAMRHDSYFVPGDLTAPAGAPVKARRQPIGIQQTLRVRSVPPNVRRVPTNYVSYGGDAAVMTPGMSQFPRADIAVAQKEIQVSWFVTSTMMDWMDEMYASAASAVSVVAEKAEAARRVLEYTLEQVLVTGLAGLDWRGLIDLQGAAYQSGVDYSSSATTLDDIHEDIVRMSQAAQSANEFRGTQPDTLLAGPRFFQLLSQKSNYDAGGFLDGAGQFGAVMMAAQGGPQARVGKLFADLGINQVILAPKLQGFRGANRDGVIWYNAGNEQGLRHVLAQAVAPVRTHTDLGGTETLWAMASAGLEAPDATDLITASVQVAA